MDFLAFSNFLTNVHGRLHLPVSQFRPVYPGPQMHLNPSVTFEQVAVEEQRGTGSFSEKKKRYRKIDIKKHTKIH